MFDEIDGLPVHVLVVHAAVVVLPLAAVLGVLYVIPRTREWARLPFLLTAVAAVPLVFVARESGKSLQAAIQPAGEVGALVAEHQDRSDLLFGLVIGYAIVAVLAFVASRARGLTKAMSQLVSVLVVVGAVAVAVQTYRVGDIGARAVWNPTGDVDFSSAD